MRLCTRRIPPPGRPAASAQRSGRARASVSRGRAHRRMSGTGHRADRSGSPPGRGGTNGSGTPVAPDAGFREDVVATLPRLRARGLAAGDRSLADDVVQDTVLLALRAEARFTPGTNLGAWLLTILRNRFLGTVGHRRRRQVALEDEEVERVLWVPAAQEAALDVRAFRRAFVRLAPVQREVLVLAAVHGLPYERIAAVCGCEVGTVKSRINRARTTLKALLLGEDAAEGTPARARRRGRRGIAAARRERGGEIGNRGER